MRKPLSSVITCLVLVFALTLVAPPARAGECWGCHSYSCMQGFDAGGLFCEEVILSCGFVYELLGLDCEMRSCRTSGACPRSASESGLSIDPSRAGGQSEPQDSVGGSSR